MTVPAHSIAGIEFKVTGRVMTVARPRFEWNTDVNNPDEIVEGLRARSQRIDLLTFAQRLPHSRPQFLSYYWEWDNVAAIPISTYENWLEHQLHRNPRNKLKKAQKLGLEVRIVPFDDELIEGIKAIQDDVPIRQGRPYSHYRETPEKIRKGYGTFLDQSVFLGAFFKGEMVGFFKLVSTDRNARTMGMLTKNRYRDLAPMNALVAKAVEICAERRIPYLVYARYDYGKVGSDTLIDFKFYNGFEHILLPRYFIPLTWRGRLALSLRLHNGLANRLPKPWVRAVRQARIGYYERRYRASLAASFAGGVAAKDQ